LAVVGALVGFCLLASSPASASVSGTISYTSGAAVVTGTFQDAWYPNQYAVYITLYTSGGAVLGGATTSNEVRDRYGAGFTGDWSYTLPVGQTGGVYAEVLSSGTGETFNTPTVTVSPGSAPPPPPPPPAGGGGVPISTDFSGVVGATFAAASSMVQSYGPGLIFIVIVFGTFMWLWRKIRAAVR
jgi:hypothetical protein